MLREILKSKLHRAVITDANVEYEGSITIPEDLMRLTNLWEGEKVLVASISTGARLETYVQKGLAGSGQIIMNGGAAHRIKKGERVSIMAFGLSEQPVVPQRILLNDRNQLIGESA
jgi:aspartate 1-decarboxylase